ncbi:MAG TPA: DUF3574 domain-containing protein [Longimicrobium sp.]|jgi:hypothetical protein|nr:DUF3574 domain-containing protein [Longimicrobium sp.]
MKRRLLLAIVLPFAASACANSGVMVGGPGVQVGIPMRRTAAFGDTVADRLFFGRTIPGGGSVSDDEWSAFLRDVVTPRFPAGLSVWRADGQWLDSQGTLEHEQTMVVEVIHAASGEVEVRLREIADEYKRRFRQDAVLRITTPARMRLYD